MLVSSDARVELRLDFRADVWSASGYSDSGLFGSSVLWALLSTWCGAEVCMLAFGVRMWLPPKGGGPPKKTNGNMDLVGF